MSTPEQQPNRRNLFLLFVVLTVAYGAFLNHQGKPLTARVAGGVAAFELAGAPAAAQEIVDRWRGKGEAENLLTTARRQIHWDFLFLLLYPAAIGLGCYQARRQLSAWPWVVKLGTVLIPAQLAAGALDVLENLALLRVLEAAAPVMDGSVAAGISPWSQLASVFATWKFALVMAGVLYAGAGGVVWYAGFRKRLSSPPLNSQ